MLVLTRKANEAVCLGDEVEVEVLAIVGEKVRLGFKAPPGLPIYRKEIAEEITASNPERLHSNVLSVLPTADPEQVVANLRQHGRDRSLLTLLDFLSASAEDYQDDFEGESRLVNANLIHALRDALLAESKGLRESKTA